jgi:tetratricopeptide (TPR) repeat protein
MITVHEILEKARASGHRLPYNEAAVLYAAAVRLADAQDATLRGRLVQIDDAGGLHVDGFDEDAPEAEPGYMAPELLAADAPPKTDQRVQVYAAGALGYELLTGKLAPQPGHAPGPELSGALGDIVRKALSPGPQERYGDLKQLHDAVEVVQPRPPAEGERNILSAVRTRFSRPPPEKEALAKLIEKLHHLETQVAQLSKIQSRLEAQQQQSLEMIERFEDGQRRTQELERRPRSTVFPAVLAGLIASAGALAAAWGLGMIAAPVLPGAKPGSVTATAASEPDASAAPAAEPVPAPDAATAAEPRSARINSTGEAADASVAAAADAAVASVDAGEPDAVIAAAPSHDAGPGEDPAAAVAGATPAPAPVPVPPAPPQKKPPARNTRAAMQHALALSQVRRGEAALEQGRADEALVNFRSALESEPNIPDAFRGMGMAFAAQGQNAQALWAYDKYLRLAPNAPDAAEIRHSIRELKGRAKVGAK